MEHHRTIHKRYLIALWKNTTQCKFLKEIKTCTIALSKRVQCLSWEYIKNTVVICNGGINISTVKKESYKDKNICMLQISNGDLWVANMTNPTLELGLIFPGNSSLVFIHFPWDNSLHILNSGTRLCKSMHSCARTQPQSLSRGTQNQVFTEDDNKYYCIGAQPGRAERGVQLGLN